MADHEKKNIVVLGAGVIGLTTALLLSASPKTSKHNITILASHMPGDSSTSYASPWAGANYDTYSPLGTHSNTLEKTTWPHLRDLASNTPEAGVWFQDTKAILRKKDRGTEKYTAVERSERNHAWLRHWREEYKGGEEGAGEVDGVVGYESVCVNTAIYLPWLVGRCLKRGVVFKRAVLGHINQAFTMHASGKKADVLVNCTGLGEKSLGGVMDEKMYPARGQTVIVREEADAMYCTTGTDNGEDDKAYLMMRAAGGGTVLGGCVQNGNWSGEVDGELAGRIVKRCVSVCPELVKGKSVEEREGELMGLSVIKHGVGLRPAREVGVRIEREGEVVHCYGHGGSGYQQSWGSAEEVRGVVEEILGDV